MASWSMVLAAALSLMLPYPLVAGTAPPESASSTLQAASNWVNRSDTAGHVADRPTAELEQGSNLRWRTPYRKVRQSRTSSSRSVASTPVSAGTQRVAPTAQRQIRQGGSVGTNEDPIDLPLVQPANFEPSNPFDDPFEDRVKQTPTTAGDQADPSEPHAQSPPKLISVRQARPIGRPRAVPSPASVMDARRVATSLKTAGVARVQAEAERRDLDALFPPGDAEQESTDVFDDLNTLPMEQDSTQPPPSPDGLDLPEEPLIPGQTPVDPSRQPFFQDVEPYDERPLTREQFQIPCDRIYQNRNCCEEDEECSDALEILRSKPITTISLDIVPPFAAGSQGADQAQALAGAQTRLWKGRRGQLLARGRFIDYRNGLVYIQGDDQEETTIPYSELGEDELCYVNAWWNIPTECRLTDEAHSPRQWQPTTVTWKASALCHKPLYFEQQQLERYGHAAGPLKQPVISAAHFAVSLLLLPYNMGIHPPNECIYALGHYRPGSCAPWLVPTFPFSLRGAAAQAGVIAALVPLPY